MARVKVKCPKCNYSFYGPEQSKQNIAALKGTAKVIGNIACRAATIAGELRQCPSIILLGMLLFMDQVKSLMGFLERLEMPNLAQNVNVQNVEANL